MSNKIEGSQDDSKMFQPDSGRLHIWFPWARSLSKLTATLETFSCQYKDGEDRLTISIAENDLIAVVLLLMNLFSIEDQVSIKVIFETDSKKEEDTQHLQSDSLYNFLSLLQKSWLNNILQGGLLSTVFQPIVDAGNLQEILGFECLLRGKENEQLIYPRLLLDIARNVNLLHKLDFAARQTAINEIRKGNWGDKKFFLNIIPTAICQGETSLRSTIDLIREAGLQPEQIVFEIAGSEGIEDLEYLRELLNYYRKDGFRIALDNFGTGYSSLKMLEHLRPDYVKLSMELIRNVDQDSFRQIMIEKTIQVIQGLGIKLIAVGVECKEERDWLVEQGADYLQDRKSVV